MSQSAFASLDCIQYQIVPGKGFGTYDLAKVIAQKVDILTGKIALKTVTDSSENIKDLSVFSAAGVSQETYFGCPEKIYWKNGNSFGGIAYLHLGSTDNEQICVYGIQYGAADDSSRTVGCVRK